MPSLRPTSMPRLQWTRPRPDAPRPARRPLDGRQLADSTEPIAVLLIGMRINRWRALHHWLPVFFAMPRMLRELMADPDGALLGYRILWGPYPGQVTVVQYWRRAGDIRAFSHDPGRTHQPAEQRFVARHAASKGAVGIWHEMLSVRAEAYQCLYADMPPMGIGAARGLYPTERPEGPGGYRPIEAPTTVAGGPAAEGVVAR